MKPYTPIILVMSSFILFTSAYIHATKGNREGITNPANYLVLMGDSILNNANYVPIGSSVLDVLELTSNETLCTAKDGARISGLPAQLDLLPSSLNKTTTRIFISAGGNDLLLQPDIDPTTLFATYLTFLRSLKAKLGSVSIYLLNLYLPSNPRFHQPPYPDKVSQWNNLLVQHSNDVGRTYQVVDIYSLLNSPTDFVADVEPSVSGAAKIAKAISLA